MARYKIYSTNPVGDYTKRLEKKRRKNSVFGNKKRRKKGCYIATCVYGSYDCPEVRVLRRYRDNKLEQSGLGRVFVSIYYAISPLLVKCFGETILFRKGLKRILDAFVKKLQNAGYENGFYEDI